jgi:hypothetical protein
VNRLTLKAKIYLMLGVLVAGLSASTILGLQQLSARTAQDAEFATSRLELQDRNRVMQRTRWPKQFRTRRVQPTTCNSWSATSSWKTTGGLMRHPAQSSPPRTSLELPQWELSIKPVAHTLHPETSGAKIQLRRSIKVGGS